jgi:N-acyl-D-aspartate/D-glutamate deacylase
MLVQRRDEGWEARMHDLVIRNAMICDGTGAPARVANLAVAHGRIVAIGDDRAAGREVIEADGLVLAPGIIDSHTHYDAQITWDPFVGPSPALGVTSVVIGNCGFTIAPCKPADRDLVMRNLTHVEGMSIEALRTGIGWGFETFPEYLDHLERTGVGVNVAAFVGHSSIRTWVMGDDAARRPARADEIDQMRLLVLDAMAAGAIGFATSTSPSHNGENGIPMPSRLAAADELRALVGALGEAGHGIFMLTKGGDTSIAFLESLAAETGRPVMVAALLHNSTNPSGVFDELDAIAAARSRGRMLYGQVSCCPLTLDFTLRSPYPFEGLAAWKPAMEAHGDAVKPILADPSFRAAIRRELEQPATVRLFNGEWDKLHVVEVKLAANRAQEGKSIAELAAASGRDPLDCMLDLALAENLDTTFTALLLNSDEQAVGRLLLHPQSSIALSDAGAHLTFFCDAGFGLHLLGHWVRERAIMSLEQAIKKLTSEPADIYGLRGRGRLVPGACADLLLFDPATVGRGPKQRVFDLPSGAPRLTTPACGVHGVWVNGVQVADAKGLRPGRRPAGRVLRDGAP